MLDPDNDLAPQSSPSNSSSISSSDLDTESTGSFFHDRSTTLGTLMGLNFPQISIRVPSSRRENNNNNPVTASVTGAGEIGERKMKKTKKKARTRVAVVEDRRRRWWKLCRDDVVTSASLGEFLEVERRLSDGELYSTAAEFEGIVHRGGDGNGRLLFADGRVLPPSREEEVVGPASSESGARRFPVLLTGICSGGGS